LYQYYIKIRLHSVGEFYIAEFPTLYTSFEKSLIYMIQHNVFTNNKYKSLITLIFTHYMVSFETDEPKQYWKVMRKAIFAITL